MVRSGADIFARNEHGRTPRQEAEITSSKIESDSIDQTIQFLVEEEKRREEKECLKVRLAVLRKQNEICTSIHTL